MLNNKGFDLWAEGYDKAVGLSCEEKSYPFAGYKDVLAQIYQRVLHKEKAVVLDIGFGTGTLTTKLYEQGCEIYGQDFSEKMIALACAKMPDAHLYQGDFAQQLVSQLTEKTYDFVIATYSLHHLTDIGKVAFLHTVQELLNDNGKILIGDIAFETQADLDNCKEAVGEEWDDEEFYFVAENLKKEFPNIYFEKVSYCAGVFILEKQDTVK